MFNITMIPYGYPWFQILKVQKINPFPIHYYTNNSSLKAIALNINLIVGYVCARRMSGNMKSF